jgi:hypothetical protein
VFNFYNNIFSKLNGSDFSEMAVDINTNKTTEVSALYRYTGLS